MKLTAKIGLDDLFYIFFYINVFCKAIGLGNSDVFYYVVLLFGMGMLMTKIMRDKYSSREVNYVLIMLLVGFLSFILTEKPTLTLTCLCVSGMKNVDLNRLFRDTFLIRGGSFCVVFALAFFELIDQGRMQMYRNGNYQVRYGMGFDHPNALHMAFFLICLSFILFYFENFRWYHALGMLLLNLGVYHYSLCRSGLVLTFFIVLSALGCTMIKTNGLIYNLICASPLVVLALVATFSLLSGLFYGELSVLDRMNEIFTGRLEYSHYYLTHYGFTLFGNRGILSDTNALFDNGYIFVYLQYGLVGVLTWLALALNSCFAVINEKRVEYALALIALFLYGFSESYLPNVFLDVGLLFGCHTIFKKRDPDAHDLHSDLQPQ